MADEFEFMDVECIFIPLADGTEMECAILDQFDYEGQGYVVVSPVVEDEIAEDMYIYRIDDEGDESILSYIGDREELEAVAEYYQGLLDELD